MDLENVNLNSSGVFTLGKNLKVLISLESLDLTANYIGDRSLELLVKTPQKFPENKTSLFRSK